MSGIFPRILQRHIAISLSALAIGAAIGGVAGSVFGFVIGEAALAAVGGAVGAVLGGVIVRLIVDSLVASIQVAIEIQRGSIIPMLSGVVMSAWFGWSFRVLDETTQVEIIAGVVGGFGLGFLVALTLQSIYFAIVRIIAAREVKKPDKD